MPSIYYKDSNNDWVLLDLGSVQKGVFTATTSNYSYNFEEAYTGYVPIVVANALGSQEVKVTSVSPTGFIIQVEENAVPCDIMFFAARGEEIPTFEEANGGQLLDYYLEQSKASSDAAQRIASYFNSSFGTMSWADMSKMSEVAAKFPSAFSGYVNKTFCLFPRANARLPLWNILRIQFLLRRESLDFPSQCLRDIHSKLVTRYSDMQKMLCSIARQLTALT